MILGLALLGAVLAIIGVVLSNMVLCLVGVGLAGMALIATYAFDDERIRRARRRRLERQRSKDPSAVGPIYLADGRRLDQE